MGPILNKQRTIINVELTNLNRTNKISTEHFDDFEECILIWLDSTIYDIDQWSEEFLQLRKITNHLKLFHNPHDCITFMKMIMIDKIFLLVSQYVIKSRKKNCLLFLSFSLFIVNLFN